MAETLAAMMLLRRADNDTCIVPDKYTPTLPKLAAECRLDVRRLRRKLAHLELHGFVKYTPGRGRGHKSSYVLMPDGPPSPCPPDCPGRDRDDDRPRSKRGRGKPSFDFTKGGAESAEKGARSFASSQVSADNALRAPRGKGGEGLSGWPAGSYGEEANAW
jgi:hypothetical protein